MRFYLIQYCTGGVPDEPQVCMTAAEVREYLKEELADADLEVHYDNDNVPCFIVLDEDSEIRVFDMTVNGARVDADGYVEITRIHRDDLRNAFEDEPAVLAMIDEMPDEVLEELADQMADDYCNQMFHDSMRIIFEQRLMPRLPCPTGFFECQVCHELCRDEDLAEYSKEEDICEGCYSDKDY